jgi:uncharacterized protein YjbJ (UPF0337 family)
MGIRDKVTGRVKKAAGDITGDQGLYRRGRQEERKDEAKRELTQKDAAANRKAREVENLERKTGGRGRRRGGGGGAESREELYAEAQRLDIKGRSNMNKDELRRAVERAR